MNNNNNNDVWFDYFLKTLYEKYPKRSQLTEALMKLLSMERIAVYRRLRKEVVFSAYDVAKIASTWNISLDSILSIASNDSHLFCMETMSYNDPLLENLEAVKRLFRFLKIFTLSNSSEYMEISNAIPASLLGNYPVLSKFFTFKWLYQYGNEKDIPFFSQFEVPEKTLKLEREYCKYIKQIKHLSYTWDNMLIQSLINDIQYFNSIYILSNEDIQQLKQQIELFLNDLESISIHGKLTDSYSKVDMYISQINIDTNYCYYHSSAVKACGIGAFIKCTAISQDETVCQSFRRWMLIQKKISIPISQVNERQRIEFFRRQKELIHTL